VLNSASIDDGNPAGSESEAMETLVQGLVAYLREIDGYRVVCRRHEETASVARDTGGLWVSRSFTPRDEILAHVAAALPLLQPCPTPRAGSDGERPSGDGRSVPGTAQPLGCHEGVWEGRDVRVHVQERSGTDARSLTVRVYVPVADWPELPLRTLASALRCHEVLLPASIGAALPRPLGAVGDGLAIGEFLSRTTPPNLAASKCI
jgi:hypothetical protein